jgi:hypothetical protein
MIGPSGPFRSTAPRRSSCIHALGTRRIDESRCRDAREGLPVAPLSEPGQRPYAEADDLIISLVDEPFVDGAERTDAGSDLTNDRGRPFPD